MVPRIVHQMFKSKTLTAPFRQDWADTWKMDGWEYRLWTDEELRDFVADKFPHFLLTYDGYDMSVKRWDAARYLLLKEFGGLYVDLDFVRLKPLDFRDNSLIFFHAGEVSNAFMASTPRHPFWDGVEDALMDSKREGVIAATGPAFLTYRVNKLANFLPKAQRPHWLPRVSVCPVDWWHSDKGNLNSCTLEELRTRFPGATALTSWTHSWADQVKTA